MRDVVVAPARAATARASRATVVVAVGPVPAGATHLGVTPTVDDLVIKEFLDVIDDVGKEIAPFPSDEVSAECPLPSA
jgi:hypothetical protein